MLRNVNRVWVYNGFMASFYLDFDYTLFDTANFREGLYEILEMNGLDRSLLKLTPEYTENGHKLINMREIFADLAEEHGISLENFIAPLEKLYARGSELTFADSMEFLRFLRARGDKVCCLTWGDPDFQREKMAISGLEPLFDDIIYTNKLKYQLDIDYANSIFIDDSLRDLAGLLEAGAQEVIRVKRPSGKNSGKALPDALGGVLEVESLAELQQIMQGEENDKS